jgi:hypothetical protein
MNCKLLRLLQRDLDIAAVAVVFLVSAEHSQAASYFTSEALTTPGLVGSYVNKTLETVTTTDDWRVTQTIAGTRTDTVVSFTTDSWGSRAEVGLTEGTDADWDLFSVQWDGYLQVTEAGDRVTLVSDDASRMWIDLDNNGLFEPEELLDNDWGGGHAVETGERSAALPAGIYPIRIQYYEFWGGNEFHLGMMPWIPEPFEAAPGNPQQVIRVLVLNFEPRIPSEGNQRLWEVFNWNDPRDLAQQFENDLEFATGGAIDIEIVEWRDLDEFPQFADGFRYEPAQYVENRRTNSGWHNATTDFYFLAEDQGLTDLVNTGQIDEIWCFGDHYFNLFGEAWMAGPNAFFVNGPTFPEIGFDRAIAGYGFNYERGVGEMLHNLSHRTENHGQRAFGSWNLSNPVTAFDHFSANYLESPGHTAGVGTCHVPANGDDHYDYWDERVVDSTAFDFVNYPTLTGATTAVSRDTWAMGPAPDYHRDYMNFYFGMMPRGAEVAADGRQANWFKYIWDFNSYEAVSGLARNQDAYGSAERVTVVGGTTHEVTVRYYDQGAVDPATIDSSDVMVRMPNGSLLPVTLVSSGTEEVTTAGSARTATYRMDAPGGAWDATDGGTYRILLQAGEVRNTSGSFFPGGDIGSFLVDIADPSMLNIAQMLADGQVTIDHTTLDIGPITNLFDRNTSTLIRTPNINPAVVTLDFSEAQTIRRFRFYFSHAWGDPAYQFSVEAADSLADLNGQTGSWQLVVPTTGTAGDTYATAELATPLIAKVVRMRVTRLTGDGYVHINEWHLLGSAVSDSVPPVVTANSPDVSDAGANAHFITLQVSDETGVDVSALRTGDIVVNGPNAFTTTPVFYGVDDYFDGSPRQATYWFIPPGGLWHPDDNGTYTLMLNEEEVYDICGNQSPSQVLGTFEVAIPVAERFPAADLAEGNAELWLPFADGATAATYDDTTRVLVGDASVRFETDGGFDTSVRFPPVYHADWDLTAASSFQFSVYAENPNTGFQENSPWIRLYDLNGDWFEYRYYQGGVPADPLNAALAQWHTFVVPLDASETENDGWRRSTHGLPSLGHIACLEIHADTWGAGFTLWYDGVGFDFPPTTPPVVTMASVTRQDGAVSIIIDVTCDPNVQEFWVQGAENLLSASWHDLGGYRAVSGCLTEGTYRIQVDGDADEVYWQEVFRPGTEAVELLGGCMSAWASCPDVVFLRVRSVMGGP